MPIRRPRRTALTLLLAALSIGCIQEATLEPRQFNTPEEQAAAYLDEVLDVMILNHVRRDSINWVNVTTQARQAAAGAKTIPETFPGIRRALELIGDGLSTFEPAQGAVIFVPTRTCTATPVNRPTLPPSIGYVRVTPVSGTDTAVTFAYAQRLQDSLGAQDRAGVRRWVVDLRGNTGGNMWPMLAGVGPLLDNGIAGYFVGPGSQSGYEYRLGAAWLNASVVQRVRSPQTLHDIEPKVAVLTDGAVSSSGEAIAVAFRNRNSTRTFGTATCGLPRVRQAFPFSDGSRLVLAVLSLSDRTRQVYSSALPPDEVIGDEAALFARVIEWIGQP